MAIVFEIVEKGKKNYYQMNTDLIFVGRDTSCEILLSDKGVSLKHCQLTLKGYTLLLEDLKSKNGTLVNQHKMKPRERTKIFIDDIIQIGGVYFRLTSHNMSAIEKKSFQSPNTLPRTEQDLTLPTMSSISTHLKKPTHRQNNQEMTSFTTTRKIKKLRNYLKKIS